ncbi:MAG: DUF4430 domain-containing protein [bacterium]|nr:DUF4430 domain-containing protein [bacterium]
MKNFLKYLSISCTVIFFAGIAQTAVAAEYVGANVRIETPDGTFYNSSVYSNGCTITDSDGAEHVIDSATAVCMLDAAAMDGGFDYVMKDSSFGLYLNQIDTYESDSNFWLFYVNFESAAVGLADYQVTDGDEILLTFGSWPNTPLKLRVRKKQITPGQSISARVKEYSDVSGAFEPAEGMSVMFGNEVVTTNADGYAEYTPTSSGGDIDVYAINSGYTRSNTATIRTMKKNSTLKKLAKSDKETMANSGIDYLLSQLDENGMVSGSQSTTEWTAIALASADQTNGDIEQAVLKYEPTVSSGALELARHILALEALGQDSRDVNGIDFVKRLKRTRTANQFGSKLYVNDDIFAGLALLAADEPFNSEALAQALTYTNKSINDDGGVSFSVNAEESDVDTTAYYLQLLGAVRGQDDVTGVRSKNVRRITLQFIKKQQNLDGGWSYQRSSTQKVVSNSSTTAVALQAIKSVGKKPGKYSRNKRHGYNFLKAVQRKTGAFKYDQDGNQSVEVMNTVYAVPALLKEPLPIKK